MGRLDLPDPRRDEDERPELVASWKQAYEDGTYLERCDQVIALEEGEIPPRLLGALAGVRTYAPGARKHRPRLRSEQAA